MSGFGKPLDLQTYAERVGADVPGMLGLPSARRMVELPPELPEVPRLIGPMRDAECSSCTDLAVVPSVIWDVNGYYRELGFEFPYRPTKREIRRALFVVQWMQSTRLTYCAKQLLNDKVRAEYDRSPLGEPFFDDYYEELLRAQAAQEVSRRIGEGSLSADDSDARERVLKEWGLGFHEGTGADEDESAMVPDLNLVEVPWLWSFYLWRSACIDTERLAAWQAALVHEFSSQGARIRFCVGYFGKSPLPWVSAVVGEKVVLFLNEDFDPTMLNVTHFVTTVLHQYFPEHLPTSKEICP